SDYNVRKKVNTKLFVMTREEIVMLRKIIHTIIAVIFGFIFIPIMTHSVYADSGEKEITILFTHDLHDNLYSFPVVQDGKTSLVGGYAKLATAIETERKRHDNTILVDAG